MCENMYKLYHMYILFILYNICKNNVMFIQVSFLFIVHIIYAVDLLCYMIDDLFVLRGRRP